MNHERHLKTAEFYYQQPPELGEGYAYQLYTYPEKPDEIAADLIGKLDNYYDRMLTDKNELPLRHTINRSLMMATGAPLYHLMELEADRRFLNAFRGGELDFDLYLKDLPGHVFEPEVDGEYGRFVNGIGTANKAAANSVLESLQDESHPYHRVWELFCIVAPEFAETEREFRGYERPADPEVLMRDVFANLGGDTMLGLLMQGVYHFHDEGLRGEAITRRLFHHLEELSLVARKKRNFFNAHFPYPMSQKGTDSSCPVRRTSKATFSGVGYGSFASLWHRASGTDEFDEISGFCPAVVDLTPITEEPQYVVEAMHELAAPYVRPRLLTRMYGTSTAAELTLIRSLFILDKTLIKTLD